MFPTAPALRAASRAGARRSAMTAATSAGPSPMALNSHIYFARASAEGPGRYGTVTAEGVTKDDMLKVSMAAPHSIGGRGHGHTPEHLFAMSYSSCFLNTLQNVAAEAGRPELARNARVHTSVYLGKPDPQATGLNKGLGLSAEVDVEGVDDDRLIQTAHEYCAYSRLMANGGNVVVKKL